MAMRRRWVIRRAPASHPAGNGDWFARHSVAAAFQHFVHHQPVSLGPSRQTYRMSDSGKASKSAIWYPDPSAGGNSYTADGDQNLNGQYGIYKIGDVRFPSSRRSCPMSGAGTLVARPCSMPLRSFGHRSWFYDGSVRLPDRSRPLQAGIRRTRTIAAT